MFQGDLDPEIAALLGIPANTAVKAPSPDIAGVVDNEMETGENTGTSEVNLADAGFPEITKRFADVPADAFSDPNYYKTALSGEGDIAQRVHTILQKYLNTKDPKDRGVFRQQMITAFWDFLMNVARKVSGKLPDSKKFLLRYGILHPTFLDAENRTLFSKIIIENTYSQPVYYLDEWLKAVGTGIVKASTTDEVRVAKNNAQVKIQQLLEKAMGKLQGTKALLKAKGEERINLEKALQERIDLIFEHIPLDELPQLSACYNDAQRRAFMEIQELLKNMLRTDHDLSVFLKDFYQAQADVRTLQDKMEEEGASVEVDVQALDTEFNTVRQMTKMTIGRQGNHYPVLTSEYFHCIPNDIGFRENIILLLAKIESIDPEAFCRIYRNRLNRIVPYVILLPNYGDNGICWEPFDRHNRATSRGRIAIPMYPKNLTLAVLSAVADLRWQVAKEKASYYWMEEGLTGNYYQWFSSRKLKGDLKEAFIQDYIIWMTKESEGIQKLDKEVRGIFWRHMPFAQPVKEKLKGRSYIYQELYQRDLNRAMSDGY
ncbi:MAG: hypothetical protein LBT93_01150 [Treponema sp.]|nr:hypothetical protein [Treponema sp.]